MVAMIEEETSRDFSRLPHEIKQVIKTFGSIFDEPELPLARLVDI